MFMWSYKPELFSVARVIKKDIWQWLLQLGAQGDLGVVRGVAQDHLIHSDFYKVNLDAQETFWCMGKIFILLSY